MAFLKTINFFRSFRFIRNPRAKHGVSFPSFFSHWETDRFTHSSGVQTCCLSTIVDSSEIECDELVDDGTAKEKHTALNVALTQLERDFGKESMLYLRDFFIPRCASVISTGSLKLDLALGIGGLPKGRIVEIFGKECSGKTTLALHVIKEAQKLGGYCAFLDVENALDPNLAEAIGVDKKNLLISCPDSAENILSLVDKLIQSGSLDVIVVDSVAALVPQCELDGVIGTGKLGVLSKLMIKAMRRIHNSLSRSETLVIFLNQIRYSPRSKQGLGKMDEVTSGGNAVGFYSAVRLRISRTGLSRTNDEVTGIEICVQVMKNKLAPGMKSADLGINFGRGLRFEPEVLNLAVKHGLVSKVGNCYFIEGHESEILDGEQAAQRYLAQNEVVFDKLVSDLRSLLFDHKP